MKKMLSIIKKMFLFTMVMTLLPFSNVYADSGVSEKEFYRQYVELQEKGVLGEDVTFEYWLRLTKEALALEKELEKSNDFYEVYSGEGSIDKATYPLKAGDIIVTNGTVSSGIVGHAGIAVSSTNILHIAGPSKTPDITTISGWNNEYTQNGDWTKIYRHQNSSIATQAAQWANRTYRNSNAKYKITNDLTTTHETYCSKIVWQAYYYGPPTPAANGPLKRLVLPYNLYSKEIPNTSHIKTFQ